MNPHRFVLQPYRSPASRFRCPQCNDSRRTFTRYIDLEKDAYLANHVGRCDREDQCGYHYTPRQYFAQNPNQVHTPPVSQWRAARVKPPCSYMPATPVTESMAQKDYADNHFIHFLAGMFGWEAALQAAERYKIGTSNHWLGATVFWQVDRDQKIRTGKIMLYDKDTGKRVKQPFNHVAWAHRLVNEDFLLGQCFFGEHLLCLNEHAVVAICESEKTAVMASIMMPGFIWLAAGSLHGLDAHKCKALARRSVWLFPDVGAYDHWTACARELNLRIPSATFAVHNEMEKTANEEERATGADMADRWIAEKNL